VPSSARQLGSLSIITTSQCALIISSTTMGSQTSSEQPICESESGASTRSTEGYSDDISWHEDRDLNRAADLFHDTYSRQPPRLEDARRLHHQFMSEVERQLREANICSRIEYTGSSYEGVKVAKSSTDDDLEFDVMIVMVSVDMVRAQTA